MFGNNLDLESCEAAQGDIHMVVTQEMSVKWILEFWKA